MLGYMPKFVVKLIIILILIQCQCTSKTVEAEVIVHFCKFSNGVTGYYDRPCEYVNTSSFQKNNSNVAYNSERASIVEESFIRKDIANPNRKKTDSALIATKRCDNAIDKVKAIEGLLQNNYLNSQFSYKKVLDQLKKSLARYKKIQKQYCHGLHSAN